MAGGKVSFTQERAKSKFTSISRKYSFKVVCFLQFFIVNYCLEQEKAWKARGRHHQFSQNFQFKFL